MSDTPQGPGWWQASDGKWYPPQATPGPAPTYAAEDDLLPAGPPGAYPTPTYQPGQPGAGAYQPYGMSYAAPQTSSKATGALVVAIVGLFLCPPILPIAALVLAAQAAKEIRESGGRLTGEGLVTASRIVSAIGLLVIVPIVLIAIAVPTFFGAQERAQDRAVQSELRSAVAAAKVYFVGAGVAPGPQDLAPIEPTLRYEVGDLPRAGVVSVASNGTAMTLSTRSDSDTCFYIATELSTGAVGFGEDEGCGPASQQQYFDAWD